jgi:hypothetical protein
MIGKGAVTFHREATVGLSAVSPGGGCRFHPVYLQRFVLMNLVFFTICIKT